MDKINLLIGTHKDYSDAGIFMYDFDQENGGTQFLGKTLADYFSHFTVSSNKEFVYAIKLLDNGVGKIVAYRRSLNNGVLTPINEITIDGIDPCYIIIDKNRTYAILANNGSGDIILYKINEDGSLSDQSQKVVFQGRGDNNNAQQHSHIQCVKFTPNEDYIIITDLGTDSIYIHKIIDYDKDTYIQTTNYMYKLNVEGSGPRSFVFHPNGKYIYLINALKNLIKFYDYNKKFATLILSQAINGGEEKPKGYTHIQISPDGLYLYISSKYNNTELLLFKINQKTGILKQLDSISILAKPTHFVLSPNGKYMLIASREENTVFAYKRNMKSGMLYSNPKRISCQIGRAHV